MAVFTLIIRPGSVHPEVQRTDGNFDAWFRRVPGLVLPNARVFDPTIEDLPDPRAPDRTIITGSYHAAYEDAAWIERLAGWIRQTTGPILGICFGHQILASAFGGRVSASSSEAELGSISVRLSAEAAAESRLAGLPPAFAAQAAHDDAVVEVPPGSTVLASSRRCAVQAFSLDHHLGLQFHPEIDAGMMRRILSVKIKDGDLDAAVGADLLGRVRDSPVASGILARLAQGDSSRGEPSG